ncbi:MAG TPA: ABC transporter ATP-binding protein [Vicinamibacterales bacterium]|jgi:lipoprotein-releasing system ATP-binding protein|nr:ABC transporter ATP-binding protein [Vicinamibacterales bacterium]
MTPFVEVDGLVKSYVAARGRLEVLHGLTLTVARGEMLAIVGASGVGKSTLLHVLGGLDAIDAGSVRIGDVAIERLTDEQRVAFRNQHVGFVFQFHHLLPEFTAIENVEMPLFIAGVAPRERRERAEALLARVGLSDRADHRPGALSGGEQQRVAVARALVARPSLLLADEPTGNLDETTAADLHQLLREMHAEHGLTSIIVTHNPRLAATCDRVCRLEGGRLTAVADAPFDSGPSAG